MRLARLLRTRYSFYKNLPEKFIEKQKGVAPERVFDNRFGAKPLYSYRSLYPRL